MKKRQVWTIVLLIIMAAAAVGFGVSVRDDVAAMNEAGAEIREQTAALEEVRVEKRKFAERLEQMGKSLRAESDSTLGSKGRAVFDMSFVAGKEQTVLDQKQWRAEKRLAFQMQQRDAAKKRVTKSGVGLAVTELVLLAAVFVVAKRAGGGTSA